MTRHKDISAATEMAVTAQQLDGWCTRCSGLPAEGETDAKGARIRAAPVRRAATICNPFAVPTRSASAYASSPRGVRI